MRRRQIGILLFNFLLTLFINQPESIYGHSHPAGMLDDACNEIQLLVRDTRGAPVRGALAVVDGHWRYVTDFQGRLSIGCQPGLKLPFPIEVSAMGFQPLSRVIRGAADTHIDVVLSRNEAGPEPSRDTVSVAELSSAVQEKSERLQQEGLRAFRHKDYLKADECFRSALELTPSSPVIYNNLAAACARRFEIAKASRWLEQALALAPLDAVIIGNLGMVRWLQNRCEESYMFLRMAIGRGYKLPAAFYAVGIMALRKGKPAEGLRDLSRVKSRDFRYCDLFRSLAFEGVNKPDDAMKSYRKFREINPVPLLSAAYPAR